MTPAAPLEGLIVKATGGFYYVDAGGVRWECRARGLFRKQGVRPLVGDRAQVEPTGEGEGYLVGLLPRKNALTRPAVANLDRLVLVASVADPAPNLFVLDKLMAIACHQGIPPALAVTKGDLADPEPLAAVYRRVGIPVFTLTPQGGGLEELRQALGRGISAFTGNSGVGKSTLLNRLDGRLGLQTGQTSRKLGRGRHTTSHVELFAMPPAGYIADTPGFSAVELERYEVIRREELADCFPEFSRFVGDCRFTGCSHTGEKGCAVAAAVERGKIPPSRWESYRALYEEAKKWKDWELKK